jgi:shikimate dehydrogenase
LGESVYQGAESFKIWTNKDADINSMKTAVLQQLKGE